MTVMIHRNVLHTTVLIGVIRFKLLILIIPIVPWNTLNHSEPTLLSRLYIDSLPGFFMPVIYSRIKFFPFMKESVLVHHSIIWTGLKNYSHNVSIYWDYDPFCHQCMNVNQGKKLSGRKWNWLPDAVVKIFKYNKIKIDHYIYIKVFYDVTVSYRTVSYGDFLNTNNNKIAFTELRRVSEKYFWIEVRE